MTKALLPLAVGAVLGAAVVAITVGTPLAQNDAGRANGGSNTVVDDGARAGILATDTDVDAEASLASLAAVPSSSSRRTAARKLLDRLGHSAASIARIAANLPPLEAIHFELDAIAALSMTDAERAIDAALALGDFAQRREALTRIATALAARNPRDALAKAVSIGDFELVQAYRLAALREWTGLDRDGLYAYVATANPDEMPNDDALFAVLAATDPERLLTESARLAPALRATAATAALVSLAAYAPLAAYERAHALGGESREARLRTIARIHAAQNLPSALAHLRSVPLHERAGLIDGIADVDLLRVVDTLLAEYSASGVENLAVLSRMRSLVFTRLATGSIDVAAILERLAPSRDEHLAAAFDYLLHEWGTYHAERALRWAIDHPDSVSDDIFASIARGLGSANPELAKQTATQLPGEQSDRWVASAAAGMAQRDLAAALDWIEPYRGRPFFESTLTALIRAAADPLRGSALGHPKAAAEFLDRGSIEMRAALLPQVAAAWAIQAPAAAGEWVAKVELAPDVESRRAPAVKNVAGIWSRRSADAATAWALTLPAGAHRDAALAITLPSLAAADGAFETRLLEAFSSDAAREEAVPNIAYALAARDRELALRLIDTYVMNATRRGEAEALIERGTVYRAVGTGNGIGIFF